MTDRAVYDIETLPNLIMPGIRTKGEDEPWILELTEAATAEQCAELEARLRAPAEVCDYNGKNFDRQIMGAILERRTPRQIYEFGQQLIRSKDNGDTTWDVARRNRIKAESLPTMIDLISYVRDAGASDGTKKSAAGLKAVAGRLGLDIFEMPIDYSQPVTESDMPRLREYLRSDLLVTEAVRDTLDEEIAARTELETIYDIPGLRDMTAAKVAETVITTEYCRASDVELAEIRDAARRQWNEPLVFELPDWVKSAVRGTEAEPIAARIDGAIFEMDNGKRGDPNIDWPDEIALDGGGLIATFGLGGIHTKDSSWGGAFAGYDVSSMYPNLMMRPGCAPAHLNEELFQIIFGTVISERMKAKRAKQKLRSEGLKLILNSTFGKMNEKYALLFSPSRFLNITVIGQLSLIALASRIKNNTLKGA